MWITSASLVRNGSAAVCVSWGLGLKRLSNESRERYISSVLVHAAASPEMEFALQNLVIWSMYPSGLHSGHSRAAMPPIKQMRTSGRRDYDEARAHVIWAMIVRERERVGYTNRTYNIVQTSALQTKRPTLGKRCLWESPKDLAIPRMISLDRPSTCSSEGGRPPLTPDNDAFGKAQETSESDSDWPGQSDGAW